MIKTIFPETLDEEPLAKIPRRFYDIHVYQNKMLFLFTPPPLKVSLSTLCILFLKRLHGLFSHPPKRMVGWLCLTSHRQRGHLETAPPFTVPCEGREAQ